MALIAEGPHVLVFSLDAICTELRDLTNLLCEPGTIKAIHCVWQQLCTCMHIAVVLLARENVSCIRVLNHSSAQLINILVIACRALNHRTTSVGQGSRVLTGIL